MAISMKDLQSVSLKKTEGAGLKSKSDKISQDPVKQMLKKSQKGKTEAFKYFHKILSRAVLFKLTIPGKHQRI